MFDIRKTTTNYTTITSLGRRFGVDAIEVRHFYRIVTGAMKSISGVVNQPTTAVMYLPDSMNSDIRTLLCFPRGETYILKNYGLKKNPPISIFIRYAFPYVDGNTALSLDHKQALGSRDLGSSSLRLRSLPPPPPGAI